MVVAAWCASAQAQMVPAPVNVVNLTASGEVEIPQDWMTLTLAAHEEGKSAAEVQRRLQAKVDQALLVLKPEVLTEQMNVHTSGFSVYPQSSGKDGKFSVWQGRAQLSLEGKDFARITRAASKTTDLAIAQVSFGVSKMAQAAVEQQAQAAAIAQFQTKAMELAKSFGFSAYTLREVHVHAGGVPARMYMQSPAMKASDVAAEALPLAVEPGKAQVQVQISGSIQLQ